ncbi:MAG: hypothetical protein MK226_01245 [Saprospiraceae bacterium]|jgi:hypothetical protein|nr:hypothetical protein [Saprospiraceae bacterium]
MDLQHAKILLEKINALYKSISADENRVSSIERDLMLSYIRQLYDSFLEVEEIEPPKPKKKKEKKKIKALDLEIEEVNIKEEKPKIKKARIIEIPDSLKELEEASISQKTSTPPPAPALSPEPEAIPEPLLESAPPAPTPSLDPIIEELFEHKTATDLSEKLSERPITDLTKSMSINDRLLFMNTLFGKSMDALNIALTHLNTLDGMPYAKPYLIKLASQHDWMDKGKQDTAKDFIKLIRRRYQ